MPTNKHVKKLRRSEKYATGNIIEIGSGKIKILDRYIEDGIVMIDYYHFGEETNITNKEVNLNRLVADHRKNQLAREAKANKLSLEERVEALEKQVEALLKKLNQK